MTECLRHRLLKQVGEGFVLTAMAIQPDAPLDRRPDRPDKAIIRLYEENGAVWQSPPVSGEIQARGNPDGQDQGFGWFVAPDAGTEGMTISFLNETSAPVTIQRATIELQAASEAERDEIDLPLWPFTLHRNIGLTFIWQRPLFKTTDPTKPSEQGLTPVSDSESVPSEDSGPRAGGV